MTYTRNESCTSDVEGCSDNGWIINRYQYNDLGGYSFIVQPWHVRNWGNPLYFASGRDWDRTDRDDTKGCKNGIAMRVFVDGECVERPGRNRTDESITTYATAGENYPVGWYYSSSSFYNDSYPLPDLHAAVGDTLFFTSREYTNEDLWLVPYETYQTCMYQNRSDEVQLAIGNWIRNATYSRNESCSTPGSNGCGENGWIINQYPYNVCSMC